MARFFFTAEQIQQARKKINPIFDTITTVSQVIEHARIAAIVVAGGGIILLANDQGQEITVHMGRNLAAELLYFATLVFWAAQAWFWSRLVLAITYGMRRGVTGLERAVVNHVPRILGTSAFAIAALAFFRAGSIRLAVICLGVGVLFYIAVLLRRRLMGIRDGSDILPDGTNVLARDLGVLLPVMGILTVVVFILGTVLSLASPVIYGTLLGAGTVTFIALGSIIPVGSALNIFSIRRRFPLIAILVILFAVFSLYNDNHAVRQTAGEPLRASADTELKRWARLTPAPEEGAPRPLVIVATAGGGLRAAYWTVTILGAVQDNVAGFSDHLFAVSGVSGGSLGATVFASLLAERDRLECAGPPTRAGTCFEESGHAVLSRDFLGPTMMSALYTDLMQRFLPVAFLPDRARALEESWEFSWNLNLPAAARGRFSNAFTGIWRDARAQGRWIPALLLNGTLREDGKRVLTSHLRATPAIFPSTHDFYTLHCADGTGVRVPRDVPVSAAVTNSARFPYLLPSGSLLNCRQRGFNHILDGGYFENFGAVTAQDLLNWVAANADIAGVPIRPIVIQIVSDPSGSLAEGTAPFQIPALAPDEPADALPPDGSRFLSELVSPVTGIFKTRSARGILAAVHLEQKVRELAARPPSPLLRDPIYVRFELREIAGRPAPALGWLLSDESRALIRDQIVCVRQNREALRKLLSAFGVPAEAQSSGRFAPVECAPQP